MAMLAPPIVRPSAPTSLSLPALPTIKTRPSTLQRRPTLKRSIEESENMNPPSSPSKRSRVTFDDDVEILSADDEESLDPLVVKEEVRRAIQRHLVGDDDSYERIKSIFAVSPDKEHAPSTRTLQIYLQAVLANVTALRGSCNGLVHKIIFSEWIGRDEAYFGLFAKFLGNLAAAQSGFLAKTSQMLVDLLGPQKTRRVLGTKPVRQPLIHRRALQVLQYITQLIPTASGSLAEVVRRRMSWEFSKAEHRIIFIKSFMELIDYVPELSSEILAAIVGELVKLDVSVQIDLDDEEDEAEDEILHHMSSSQTLLAAASQPLPDIKQEEEMDDIESSSDESDLEGDEDFDPVEKQRRRLKEDVQQVDLIMDMLFRFYTKAMTSTVMEIRDSAVSQLNAQFHNIILPTFRSRHPQFLIFHFAQSSPILVDEFVSSCIRVLVDKKQSQVLRHSAAAYFSGFVGRGAQVSPAVVSDCMELLCEQLNILRKAYEPGCRGPDLKRYGDFYATFQAIVYIFCFRWRDLASATSDFDDESDVEDEEIEQYHFPDSIRNALSSAVYSSLNPLRVCTPVIMEQFADLTFALQFLYLHSKMETNKQVRLHGHWRSLSDLQIQQPERDSSWLGDNGVMEGYFPYDPYELPISKHWVSGDYVEWRGIPGEVHQDTDTEDDEDMEVAPRVVDEDTATEED